MAKVKKQEFVFAVVNGEGEKISEQIIKAKSLKKAENKMRAYLEDNEFPFNIEFKLLESFESLKTELNIHIFSVEHIGKVSIIAKSKNEAFEKITSHVSERSGIPNILSIEIALIKTIPFIGEIPLKKKDVLKELYDLQTLLMENEKVALKKQGIPDPLGELMIIGVQEVTDRFLELIKANWKN